MIKTIFGVYEWKMLRGCPYFVPLGAAYTHNTLAYYEATRHKAARLVVFSSPVDGGHIDWIPATRRNFRDVALQWHVAHGVIDIFDYVTQ